MQKYLFMIMIIIGVYLLSAVSVIFNPALYTSYQEKNNVQIVHKEKINLQMVDYFKGKDVVPPVFDAKETMHLLDVKNLIQHLGLVFWIAFFLGIWLLFRVDNPLAIIFKGAIGALILLFVLAIFPFDMVFTQFHRIFFVSGTWIFPESSFLTSLYPFEFFLDMFFAISYRVVGLSLLLLFGCKIVTTRNFNKFL